MDRATNSSYYKKGRSSPRGVQLNKPASLWQFFYPLFTILIPDFCLRWFMTEQKIKPWREKVALVILILIMCAIMGLMTFGMNKWICKGNTLLVYNDIINQYDSNGNFIPSPYMRENDKKPNKYTFFNGQAYIMVSNNSKLHNKINSNLHSLESSYCKGKYGGEYSESKFIPVGPLHFTGSDIVNLNLVKINDKLYEPKFYNKVSQQDKIDFNFIKGNRKYLNRKKDELTDVGAPSKDEFRKMRCTLERCYVGKIYSKTWGCLMADLLFYLGTICIFSLLIIKFLLAAIYTAFIKKKNLTLRKKYYRKIGVRNKKALIEKYEHELPTYDLPANKTIIYKKLHKGKKYFNFSTFGNILSNTSELKKITPPTITLVNVYSEDMDGLRLTFDSLYDQIYENQIAFIICDGHVKGITSSQIKAIKYNLPNKTEEDIKEEGERTTPEIVLSLFNEIYYVHKSEPYFSIGENKKRINSATVIGGLYESSRDDLKGKRRPLRCVVIIKDGNKLEKQKNVIKRGNRGKRDSQIILLTFFHRLYYSERLTQLDINILKTLQFFNIDIREIEFLTMIDADTILDKMAILNFALTYNSDRNIIGICGETRILNKNSGYISMCQVFEYFISHHLIKSFESVFGGLTCLPGCFCSYRIFTVEKDFNLPVLEGDIETNRGEKYVERYLPVICNSFIVDMYSVSILKSLHDQNLYSLGEDRFLTTLILKTFYKQKLIFTPGAICYTEVPDNLTVLFSQRRRWINSTVHNLLELLGVDNLCGTFCFSMQFVVLFDLFGTLVLPVALFFTAILIINSILITPAWVPLIMLLLIFVMPSFLIFLVNFDISLLYYLLVYITSLPLWNFMLPIYAFWHFDDFSWGETRRVKSNVEETEEIDENITEDVKLRGCEEVFTEIKL